MGGAIERMAFLPPPRVNAVGAMQKRPEHIFVQNAFGTAVSLLHFKSPTAKNSASPVTLLWSHGNAEDLVHGYQIYKDLARLIGADIVAYDYSGYGASGDGPKGRPREVDIYADANAALKYVLEVAKVPANRVVLLGRSLGSGAAVELAYHNRGLGGLILISPIMSAVNVAGPVLAKVLKMSDIFVNVAKVRQITDYPVLIIHGMEDEVVPFAHGIEVFNLLRGVNRHVTTAWVDGARHNDVEFVMGDRWITELRTMVSKCERAASGSGVGC